MMKHIFYPCIKILYKWNRTLYTSNYHRKFSNPVQTLFRKVGAHSTMLGGGIFINFDMFLYMKKNNTTLQSFSSIEALFLVPCNPLH